MKTSTLIIGIILVLIIAAVVIWYPQSNQPLNNFGQTLVASASYLCKSNKTIDASFYKGPQPAVELGQMPQPNGNVSIKLSDGRSFNLKQTISADGTRYSDGDPNTAGSETIVFWSKGNGAFVLENNTNQTFIGCVALAKSPGDLPNAYVEPSGLYSIRYP